MQTPCYSEDVDAKGLRLLGTWIMSQTHFVFLLCSDVLKDAAVQFYCEANGGNEWL